jgi:hypothetical protein
MRILRSVVLSLICLASSFAAAQLKVSYYSSHAKSGQPIPHECIVAGDTLNEQLKAFPRPDSWTFIVACDDMAWTDLMLTARNVQGRLIYGATNPDNHTTLLRGTTLRGEGDNRMTAEHLVSHELAHIYMHSSDENRVDKQAVKWMQERAASQPAVVASLP